MACTWCAVKQWFVKTIKSIKRYRKYSKCYDKMEERNIATFGMCSGKNKYNPNTGTKHADRKCLKCPFYTRVDD